MIHRGIDAHSHIWPPETGRFPLVAGQAKKDLNPPSFTDDELMAIARPEGVGRVVLIQHSVYHLFDNSYLIDAVRRHPKLFRIVGMVDDRKPAVGDEMKKLLPQGVTGFRITPFIRKDQPDKWLDTPGMHEMWKTGAETRQPMCCLINVQQQLAGIDAMCEKYPDTPVVIDHFARIGVDGQMREEDIRQLNRLARHKHTSVKISAYYALGQKKAASYGTDPHDPQFVRHVRATAPDMGQRFAISDPGSQQLPCVDRPGSRPTGFHVRGRSPMAAAQDGRTSLFHA